MILMIRCLMNSGLVRNEISARLNHKDPFDRMIVAQAKVEGMTLVSHDSIMTQYPITVIW